MKKSAVIVIVMGLVSAAYLLGRLHATRVVNVPPAEWAEGSLAAAAWREWIVSMEAAAGRVFAATDQPLDRLEGLMMLAQLSSAALEMKLAKGDPGRPRFTDWMADYRKFLGDSPDAVYQSAEISAAHDYEVSGNIADADYLGFIIYGRTLNGWNRAAANLSTQSLAVDENGDFRIIVSKDRPADDSPDWLQLEEDSHMIMVRQYFHDREHSREAIVRIRNLEPVAYGGPEDAAVANALSNASTFFNDTLDGVLALATMMSSRPNDPAAPKTYNQDFGGIFYPTPDNEYLGTWFRVEADEALIVEGETPDAPYWSVSLQNRWLQSLDTSQFHASLNDSDIKTIDGRYRIILSHRRPPNADNWLELSGHTEGLLAIRYQTPLNETRPPSLKLVKFDTLPTLF